MVPSKVCSTRANEKSLLSFAPLSIRGDSLQVMVFNFFATELKFSAHFLQFIFSPISGYDGLRSQQLSDFLHYPGRGREGLGIGLLPLLLIQTQIAIHQLNS